MVIRSILTIVLLALSFSTKAEDTVTIKLSTEDRKLSSNIESQDSIIGSVLNKVYAYIKISSDSSNVRPNTFYLEWRRRYINSEEVLFNYNNDEKWMIYKRRINVMDDYYRVHKTIFGSKPGIYEFRVYTKDNNGDYFLVGKEEIEVREGS